MLINDDYITTEEAGNLLRYKPYTMRRSRLDGTLGGRKAPPHYKIGGRVWYKKTEIEQWFNEQLTQ